MKSLSADEYAAGILNGNRTVLSRSITLIESSSSGHRSTGEEVLEKILPHTGRSVRIGITGVPGSGKSTFIESMGRYITGKGKRLAVLAIDPSSTRSGGSILGDKTRMPHLSASREVFIRPSPTSGTLGGVARKTRETMLLCEAAGFDTILVETTGVGQSETAVHSMVDVSLLLMLAGAGDELQGIKRGIIEMAHLIAINKADGENRRAAELARQELENALALFPPAESGWKTAVLTCSATEGSGIEEIWTEIEKYLSESHESGFFHQNRARQATDWMHETIEQQLKALFYRHPEITQQIEVAEAKVRAGGITPFRAASELLKTYTG